MNLDLKQNDDANTNSKDIIQINYRYRFSTEMKNIDNDGND